MILMHSLQGPSHRVRLLRAAVSEITTLRQGGFTDPLGHAWLVGDKTPLLRLSSNNWAI